MNHRLPSNDPRFAPGAPFHQPGRPPPMGAPQPPGPPGWRGEPPNRGGPPSHFRGPPDGRGGGGRPPFGRGGGPPPPNHHPHPGFMGRGGGGGGNRGPPPPPPHAMSGGGFRGGPGRFGPGRGDGVRMPHMGGRPPIHMQENGPPSMGNGPPPPFGRGGGPPNMPPGQGGPPRGPPFPGRPPFGPGRGDGRGGFRGGPIPAPGRPGGGFPGRGPPPPMQQQQPPHMMRGGNDPSGRGRGMGGPPPPFFGGRGPEPNFAFPPPSSNPNLHHQHHHPQAPPPLQQPHQAMPPNNHNFHVNASVAAAQQAQPYAALANPPSVQNQQAFSSSNTNIYQQASTITATPIIPPMSHTAVAATTAVASVAPIPQTEAVERAWEEYTDASTGNKYYSNGVTSSWTKPEAMIETEKMLEQAKENTVAPADPRSKKRKLAEAVVEFGSKEEALQAFKKMLADRDVAPAQKWSEIVKLFTASNGTMTNKESNAEAKSIAIWEACQNILTTGERKQALAEYQTKLAKDLRNKERQGRQRTKEGFLKLLADVVSSTTVSGRGGNGDGGESSNGNDISFLRYQDIEGMLQKDERYHAVPDDETREMLFLEYVEEYRKREERRKQNEHREAQNQFVDFLKELEKQNSLTCAAPYSWNAFVDLLMGNDESVSSDKDSLLTTISSSVLNNEEKDFIFKGFLDDMKQAEEEDRLRSQEERRQAVLAQREFFRETLVQAAQDGKILPSSSYNSVVDSVLSQENSFAKLQQHDRDRPKELFEEFVNDWNEMYRRDRLFLSDLVRKRVEKSNDQANFKDETTTFEAFCAVLLEEASDDDAAERVKQIIDESSPVTSAQLYFNELKQSSVSRRRTSQLALQNDVESSEDEGEIAEDE